MYAMGADKGKANRDFSLPPDVWKNIKIEKRGGGK
jgi:hypothetical protein